MGSVRPISLETSTKREIHGRPELLGRGAASTSRDAIPCPKARGAARQRIQAARRQAEGLPAGGHAAPPSTPSLRSIGGGGCGLRLRRCERTWAADEHRGTPIKNKVVDRRSPAFIRGPVR